MKLITVLRAPGKVASRLTDLSSLKLPQLWERKIAQIIHDNHMAYEPWVESADSFEELKKNLKERGFTDLPMGGTPLLDMAAYVKAPVADTGSIPERKTMIRKKT